MAITKRRPKRPIHKGILLHPLAVFIMLCFGVAMVGTTLKAFATDIAVVAKVSAPLPASAASVRIISPITEPWLQQTVVQGNSPKTAIFTNTKTVILTGDCPAASHIEIYRNNLFAGVTACIGDPTFSITIDLDPGLNIIVARVFNITNDEGPASLPIYLDYQLPPSQQPISSNHGPEELRLSSDFLYLGFLVNERASWNVIIRGGTAPYKMSVDWGDGHSYSFTQATEGNLNIRHTYSKASGPEGFPIAISVTDATGQKAVLSLLTIISKPNTKQAQQIAKANSSMSPGFVEGVKKWLWVAWPVYVFVLLMMVSFWLGEREEYFRISKKLRRKKRR